MSDDVVFWTALVVGVFFAPSIIAFCVRNVARWQILQLNVAAIIVPFLWFVAVLTAYGENNGLGD